MERRRLLDNENYEVVNWIVCSGQCLVRIDTVQYLPITETDLEFRCKRNGSSSTSEVIAHDANASLQVYFNGSNIYNQGVSKYTNTSTIYSVQTTSTATNRTLTVNGSTVRQTFSRDFSQTVGYISLFSQCYGYPNLGTISMSSNDYYNFINIKINGDYVSKCVFMRKVGGNEIFLYDTLNNNIYRNIGTGSFLEANV